MPKYFNDYVETLGEAELTPDVVTYLSLSYDDKDTLLYTIRAVTASALAVYLQISILILFLESQYVK